MLFNSLPFILFFPIVCILYWTINNKYRNLLLLVASYYFYMSWEPIYACLILFTSITTWLCAQMMYKRYDRKRFYLTICVTVNLFVLLLFKYYNFCIDSITSLIPRLSIPHSYFLLPVGISFYTFQCIGYTIDVYRQEIKPESNFITYALFVSFFPQLVAGPIERAKNLLPQFHEKHFFDGDNFIIGLKMIIWGYFMKLCVAGNVAPYVDAVYNNVLQHNGTSLTLASIFFSFQIFCDFGGYSLIAIGTAKCLGFRLMQNFNHPYLSLSVKDFWYRWHISLSSWFSDYVYIPLGGSRCGLLKNNRNLLLTMLISGIWHGANWTFVLWGGLHGFYLICNKIYSKFLNSTPKIPHFFRIITTYLFVVFAWIIFRSNNITDVFVVISKILFDHGNLYKGDGIPSLILPVIMILLLMIKEIKDEYGIKLAFMHHRKAWISIPASALVVIIIILCAEFNSGQFIYFQF